MADILESMDKLTGVSKGTDKMNLGDQEARFVVTVYGENALEHQEVQGADLDVMRTIQTKHSPTVKEIANALPGMSETSIRSIITTLYKRRFVNRC